MEMKIFSQKETWRRNAEESNFKELEGRVRSDTELWSINEVLKSFSKKLISSSILAKRRGFCSEIIVLC